MKTNSALRYWCVAGLLIHRENATSVIDKLVNATNDESVSVAVLAAETLYRIGEEDRAIPAYIRFLQDEN